MPRPDYNYGDVLDDPDAQAQRDAIINAATPKAPAPPTEDHPMVQFARNLLQPIYDQQQEPFDSGTYTPPAPAGAPEGYGNDPTSQAPQSNDFFGRGGTLDRFGRNIPVLGGILNAGSEAINSGPLFGLAFGNDPKFEGLTPDTPVFEEAQAERRHNLALGILGPEAGGAGKATKAAESAAQKGAFELQQAIQRVIDLTRSGTSRSAALDAVEKEFPKVKIGDVQTGSLNQATSAAAPFAKTAEGAGAADVAAGIVPNLPGAVADATTVAKLVGPEVSTGAADRRSAIQDYLAGRGGADVERQIGASTPGFLRTAEQKIALGESPAVGARPTGPTTARGVADEIGTNLEKVDAPVETKELIARVANANDGFAAQRQGVQSIGEIQAAADAKNIDIAKYAHLKPGTTMDAPTLKSTFDAMVSKGNDVVALQEKVRAASAAGVKSDALNLELILAATEHQTLQRVFSGARTESGRSLRILREVSSALKAGTGTAYDRALESIGGKEHAGELVKKLQLIWANPELDAVGRERATYKFIQHLDTPKFFDRINALWINSILSSPVTHSVNITGQALLKEADIARKFVTAGVEAVGSVGGLRRPREVFFTEALAEQFGVLSGLGDGFKRAGTMLKTGVTPESMTKFAETGVVGNREVNHALLNIPLRLLGAEDQVFYAIGYSSGLKGAAAKIASREKQSLLSGAWGERVSELLQKPTEEMLTLADAAGKRAGLRTDANVGALIKLRDIGWDFGGPVGKFSPLRYVIPFINTPTLLVKIGAEYSPLGFVRAVTAKTGAQRSEALAAALMGSTGMGFLAAKYSEGLINGDVPQNPAERDAFYAEGRIPFSVKIGNEWVSFNRLEPIATPLKWTAVLLDAVKNNDGKPGEEVAVKMAFALAGALKNETFFSSLSNFMDAMNDENKAQKFLSHIVGGFVPAALRTVVQSQDPFIREPKGIIEMIEATLPFLNQNVPIRDNVYGERSLRTEGKQGISGIISPVDYNAVRPPDPVTEKVNSYQLPEMAGQPGVRELQVGYVSKEIASYRLKTEEAAAYQRYAGQATHNLLEALFADKRPYDDKPFSALTHVDQIRAIRKTIGDARDVGRAQAADEILHAASSTVDIQRGASMRLSTIDGLRDRAHFIEGLQKQGKLNSEVISYLNDNKKKNTPDVSEYLKAAPLVPQYLAIKPYFIGNAAEWKQLEAAKKTMSKYIRDNPPPQGYPQLDWFQKANPQEGSLVRRYSYDIVRNPARHEFIKKNPFLEKYLNGTTYTQIP